MTDMNAADLLVLGDAVRRIEHPSVGARIANVVGSPVEKLVAMLPARATETIHSATRAAIHGALKISLKTLAPRGADAEAPPASNWWHKAASAASGAAGGAFGLLALTVENRFTFATLIFDGPSMPFAEVPYVGTSNVWFGFFE